MVGPRPGHPRSNASDGAPGLVVFAAGALKLVLRPTIVGSRITAFEAIADPDRLAGQEIRALES